MGQEQETFEEIAQRALDQLDRAVRNIGCGKDPSEDMLKGAGGSGGFFGGMKYDQYQRTQGRTNGSRQFPGGINNEQIQNRNGLGRPVTGDVIGKDDKSITVKTQDGGSKIIILSNTTTYSKTSEGEREERKRISKKSASQSFHMALAETAFAYGHVYGQQDDRRKIQRGQTRTNVVLTPCGIATKNNMCSLFSRCRLSATGSHPILRIELDILCGQAFV